MSVNNDNCLTINDFRNICRTCTSKSDLIPLYDNVHFVEMLQFCTMINFDKYDNLPKNICPACISGLRQAYKFINMCRTIDTTLRTCVTEYEKAMSEVKIENETFQSVGNIVINKTELNSEERKDNTKTTSPNIESVCLVKNEPRNLNYKECYNAENVESIENNSVYIKNENTGLEDKEFNEIQNEASNEINGDPNFKIEDESLSNVEDENEIIEPTEEDPSFKNNTPKINQKSRPFQCTICPKSFILKTHLKMHGLTHIKNRHYKCNICNKIFSHPIRLKYHYKKHTGDQAYKCDICDLSFSQSWNLTNHQKIHTGEKPFECEICKKSFREIGTLNKHARIHSGEKPFQCNVCKMEFSRSDALRTHSSLHKEEAPYKCDICHKMYNRSGTLKIHSRSHSGEKPYSCDCCDKSFTSSSALSVHRRIHTGIRAYSCKSCPKTFSRSTNLTRHYKDVHSKPSKFCTVPHCTEKCKS